MMKARRDENIYYNKIAIAFSNFLDIIKTGHGVNRDLL